MKKKDLSWIDRELGSSWPDVTRGETMDRMKVLQSVVKQVLKDDPKHYIHDKWIEKVAEEIAIKFSKLVGFAQDVDRLEGDKRREKEEYEKRMEDIERQKKDLQSRCPHPSTTFYPDASGNNDSWRECDICGAEVSK